MNGRVGVAKSMDVLPGDEVTISSWAMLIDVQKRGRVEMGDIFDQTNASISPGSHTAGYHERSWSNGVKLVYVLQAPERMKKSRDV